MGIKVNVEPGANVQITDKQIVNNIVYGDVVQNNVYGEKESGKVDDEAPKKANKPNAQRYTNPNDADNANFITRVKAIMRKAATKNGQRVESKARGHEGSYIYNVDAETFCKAIDEMADTYSEKLKAFLGGTMENVQVTKVCSFIGRVIRMQVVNDVHLQMTDILFAFDDYYKNAQTVKTKLSDTSITEDQDVLFGTFEGILKKHKG